MTLLLSRSEVKRIVEVDGNAVLRDLVARVAGSHCEMAEGLVRQHPRIYLRYPDEGSRRPPGLFSMSALLPKAGIMGTRLAALSGVGGDAVSVLFDHHTLKCLAIIDNGILHEYRTGASAGLASQYLARTDARTLACIGSSSIARGTASVLCAVLPGIRQIFVFSPDASHREKFAEEMHGRLGLPVHTASSAEEAAAGAQVLVTATDADRPVVADEAIAPGTHVNVMARNEVSHVVLKKSKLVTAWAQSGKIDPPLRDPIPDSWIYCELSNLVTGSARGRETDGEITVYLGGGVGAPAMWDVAAAATFFDAACRLGIGTEIDFTA